MQIDGLNAYKKIQKIKKKKHKTRDEKIFIKQKMLNITYWIQAKYRKIYSEFLSQLTENKLWISINRKLKRIV